MNAVVPGFYKTNATMSNLTLSFAIFFLLLHFLGKEAVSEQPKQIDKLIARNKN